MSDSFDLFEKPFLNWRATDGRQEKVGFRELFEKAGSLTPFSDHGPQTTFAVIRVLLVLMHQTRPKCDAEWQRLWDAGHFPGDWLAEIEQAAAGKFDLFHSERPFLQMKSSDLDELIAAERAAEEAKRKKKGTTRKKNKTPDTEDETEPKRKTPAYLFGELPTGSNINHSHHTHDKQVRLCPSCSAQGLLRLAPFCPDGGSGLSASVNGSPPVYLLPVWDTLLSTLLLNWSALQVTPSDRAAWDDGPLRESGQIGVAEGFTWEPRRVWLCRPTSQLETCDQCGTPDTAVIREMIFKKHRPTKINRKVIPRVVEWRDPHLSYAVDSQGKKDEAFPLVVQEPPSSSPDFAGGRWTLRMWIQVADALLQASETGENQTGCQAVRRQEQIATASGRKALIECIVPLVRAGQDKSFRVESSRWELPQLEEPSRDVLRKELLWIKNGLAIWEKEQIKREKMLKAEPDTILLPDFDQLAEFERRAEGHFRALLQRKGKKPEDWWKAVREDARKLNRSAPHPGRALDTARTRQAIEEAIETAFPLPQKEVTT